MNPQAELDELLDVALADVPAAARSRLIEVAELMEIPPGGRIAAEGDRADAMHVIESGTVQLGIHQRQAELCVATLGPGDLLGWSWLVSPHRWQFDATSPLGATIWRIPADVLRSEMEVSPEVAAALATAMLSVLSTRLRDARVQLLDLFAGDGAEQQR